MLEGEECPQGGVLRCRVTSTSGLRRVAVIIQMHLPQVRLNKWLTELEQMFYGMSFSFDKSLRGEGDLSASLLKNVYNDNASKQKSADLLARYITR